MRRGKMLAAAVVSACLTLGSVTAGWAAWEWEDNTIKTTMKSSTEYATGQADAQGEILVRVNEWKRTEQIGVDIMGNPMWNGVWEESGQKTYPVGYLRPEDGIYLEDLMIVDPRVRHYGGGEVWLSLDELEVREVYLDGVIPEEDGSVCCQDLEGVEGFYGLSFVNDSAPTIHISNLEFSQGDTSVSIDAFYPKVKEAALAAGHQPEEYVFLLTVWMEVDVSQENVSRVFIRFTDDGTAETPASSVPRTGVWKEDQTGWWIAYPDGSYLVNGWYQSPESGFWYYMGADGYMLENRWLQDPGSGLWYYLGNGGAMLTGAYTPDGYWVGANGVWAQ